MKKRATIGLLLTALGVASGCARPNEIGYTPVYTDKERGDQILRNWDYEGKQTSDDVDDALLLRPSGHLTIWSIQ